MSLSPRGKETVKEAAETEVLLDFEEKGTTEASIATSVSQDRVPVQELSNTGADDPSSSTVFEGDGLEQVGSARHKDGTFDEEFDYAFEGGKREGEFHKQVFQPKAIPVRLLSDVRQQPLHAVEEEHEEEHEDDIENEASSNAHQSSLPNYVPNSWATFQASTSQLYSYDNPPPGLNELQAELKDEGGTELPSSQLVRLATDQQVVYSLAAPWPQPAPVATVSPDTTSKTEQQPSLREVTENEAQPSNSDSIRTQPGQEGNDRVQVKQDEWELANQQRQAEVAKQDTATVPTLAAKTETVVPAITYHEALVHFMGCDVSATKDEVLQSLPAEAGGLLVMLCMAPPSLKGALKEEQLQILGLAKVPLKDDDPMHIKLLQSIYTAFTGRYTNSRFGNHWADIGFQGTDPATDLRSCGILGLLHLYYLHHHNISNATKIYQLSRNEQQEFPLAVVSLNITKWTIQVVRQGLISKDANRTGSLTGAAAHFYVGTFYEFYSRWRQGKTMKDSGYVLKDLEIFCKKKPSLMLKNASSIFPPTT